MKNLNKTTRENGRFLKKNENIRTVCVSENGRFMPKYGLASSDSFAKLINKQTNPSYFLAHTIVYLWQNCRFFNHRWA